MKILVIGSEGNIGSKLAIYLKQFHEIYECDQVQGYRKNYSVVNILSGVDLTRVFDKFRPDVVYNLAAMVSRVTCEISPSLTIDVNVSGLSNVVQSCKIFGSKLISFSTSEVYGNIGGVLSEDSELKPNNIYGLSKMLGEELVKYEAGQGLQAVIVRPCMFYHEDETFGVHRSAMIHFAESLVRKKKVIVHKNSERSWLHINDAVKILEKLAYLDRFYVINIAHPVMVETKWIVQRMCGILSLEYWDYVTETELPDKMTLKKIVDTSLQAELTGINPEIDIETGINLVLKKVKERCK